MVIAQWLTLAGVAFKRLWTVHLTLFICGAITLALNSAPSAITGHYARALVEAVAPLLLIAWAYVGPKVIELYVEVRTEHRAAVATAQAEQLAADRAEQQTAADRVHAAEQAEANRRAAQLAADRAAAAEQARLAAQTEQARIAAAAAERARRDEADRLAAEALAAEQRAAADRAAAERARADREAAEQRTAAARAEADRIAAEALAADAERARLAALAEAERAAADRAAVERAAARTARTKRTGAPATRTGAPPQRTGAPVDRTTPAPAPEPADGTTAISHGEDLLRAALVQIHALTRGTCSSWADVTATWSQNRISNALGGMRKQKIKDALTRAEPLLPWAEAEALHPTADQEATG
jgi:hypothetical protein